MKKIVSIILSAILLVSATTFGAFAAQPEAESPPLIGQSEAPIETIMINDTATRAVAQVWIRSYATYDKDDGVVVNVELYVPWYILPKPKFTAMNGTVELKINNQTYTTWFDASANETSTISMDVDTFCKAASGTQGTVTIAGLASATNALAGGGAFGITYKINIP